VAGFVALEKGWGWTRLETGFVVLVLEQGWARSRL